MPSKEQLAFWAAIRESPADDVPRLVYADWLEEHDEPERAEFIRIQCSLAILGPDRRKGRKQRKQLEPREQDLLTAYGDQWLAPVGEVLRCSNPRDREDRRLDRLRCRRGFPNGSYLGLESAHRLASAGDSIEPFDNVWISECGARYSHESVVEIARWSGAGVVLGLSVASGSNRDIAVIVGSSYLRNLSHLGVWHGQVTDAGMTMLANWPFAGSLQFIDLKDNPISDAGAISLAESPYLGQLRRLDLSGTFIGSIGQQRLHERFGEAVHS